MRNVCKLKLIGKIISFKYKEDKYFDGMLGKLSNIQKNILWLGLQILTYCMPLGINCNIKLTYNAGDSSSICTDFAETVVIKEG